MDNEELRWRLDEVQVALTRLTDLICGQAITTKAVDKVETHAVLPATALQGYLSGRWNRRDGTVY